MSFYYFETNALRNLNKIINCCTETVITSSHSIIELLSGIKTNEQDFIVRKKCITNVINSSIPIIWDLPTKIIFESFGFNHCVEDWKADILSIINVILDSKNISDFHESIIKANLQQKLQKLIDYDEFLTNYFFAEITTKISTFREVFDHKTGMKLKNEFATQVNIDSPSYNEETRKILRDKIRDVIASDISKSKVNSIVKKNVEEIKNSYNNSLDVFIETSGIYCIERIIQHEMPSKNDFADLYHTVYLTKNSFRIVSDDKLLLNLLRKLYKYKILSCDEFKTKKCQTLDSTQ